MDIEYFRFTQKRSTIDFFHLMQLGEDAKRLIPQYIKDYWLISLFTFIQVWVIIKLTNIPVYEIKKMLNLFQNLS